MQGRNQKLSIYKAGCSHDNNHLNYLSNIATGHNWTCETVPGILCLGAKRCVIVRAFKLHTYLGDMSNTLSDYKS